MSYDSRGKVIYNKAEEDAIKTAEAKAKAQQEEQSKAKAQEEKAKTLKEIRAIIKNNKKNTSIPQNKLDAYIWERTNPHKTITDWGRGQLASLLNCKTDDTSLINALKKAGFSKGGIAKFDSGIFKKVGEDGIGLVRNGEGFVRPEDVPAIKELLNTVPLMNSMMDNLIPLKNVPIPLANTNNSKTVNIDNYQQIIELPNVTDPKSFVAAYKNSQEMQSAVQNSVSNVVLKPYDNTFGKFQFRRVTVKGHSSIIIKTGKKVIQLTNKTKIQILENDNIRLENENKRLKETSIEFNRAEMKQATEDLNKINELLKKEYRKLDEFRFIGFKTKWHYKFMTYLLKIRSILKR